MDHRNNDTPAGAMPQGVNWSMIDF